MDLVPLTFTKRFRVHGGSLWLPGTRGALETREAGHALVTGSAELNMKAIRAPMDKMISEAPISKTSPMDETVSSAPVTKTKKPTTRTRLFRQGG